MSIWRKIRWQLPGFIAALLSFSLSLFGKELEQVLEKQIGVMADPVFVLIGAGIAVLIFYLISRAVRLAPLRTLRQDEKPPPMPGLVLLVGPGRRQTSPMETAAEPAIEYHRVGNVLRACWLVTTQDGFEYASQLREQYQKLGIQIPEPFKVANPFNVRETFEVVSQIYREHVPQAGLQANQVIADLTGATKPMTIGMALACTVNNRNYPMQYMLGGGYGAPYKTEPMLIKFETPTD
ncbi:MAG: hypothetical protein N2559_08380 [Anaerolineae bacterium]|nr:hypothetical protein [Anaerolineae bacterium]